MRKSVVLMSDFGTRDGAGAVMEGAIRRIGDIQVIHLTHQIAPFDVREGAFLLLTNYWHFREGTVFVAVVDPGVGTNRNVLLVETKNYFFIGPDNGILWPVMEAEEIRRVTALNSSRVREAALKMTGDDYFRRPISSNFEGRDVYCPATALYLQGVTDLGEKIEVEELRRISLATEFLKDDFAVCKVVFVDDYGNLVIGCTRREFDDFIGNGSFSILVRNETITCLSSTFAQGQGGELVAIFGGDFEHPTKGAFLEIAINEGNAADTIGIGKGEELVVIKTS